MVNGGHMWQGRKGRRGVRLTLGLVWLLAAWLVFGAPAGATVAGSPQVPQAPQVVFFENFENNVDPTPILLTHYKPASPFTNTLTYTADTYWLSDCNGTILAFDSPDADINKTTCVTTDPAFIGVKRLAYALGQFAGVDPTTAHAVTAWTESGYQAAGVPFAPIQFETVGHGNDPAPIPLVASNRFVTFSVEAAETSCTIAAARVTMFFYLKQPDGTEIPLFNTPGPAGTSLPGTPITPCTDPASEIVTPPVSPTATQPPQVHVGNYAGDRALLFSGSSLGIVLRNPTSASGGNDGAFTNIRVLDATPQLDKQFVPDVAERGHTTDLVFTITNTSDLAAKQGWSFSDTLPPGLVVATPRSSGTGSASTTCGDGTTVDAPAGGSMVSVTGGNLPASTAATGGGDPYCEVIVKVTSAVNGTYTNSSSAVTVTGLNPPGDATVQFGDADLALVKAAHPVRVIAGRQVLFSLRVVNHGPLTARAVHVSDPLPAGLAFVRGSPDCTLSGRTVHCTLASLAAGQSAVFHILARVSPGLRVQFVNTAYVSSHTPDPNHNNNSFTVTVPVTSRDDVTILKRITQQSVVAGGQLKFVLVVHNRGPSRATQVTVTDPLAPQLTPTAAVPSQGTCSIASGVVCRLGSVAAGGSAQVLVYTNVAQTTDGLVANTAHVTSAETDTRQANNTDVAGVRVRRIPVPPTIELPSPPGAPAVPGPVLPITPEHPQVTAGQQNVSNLQLTKHVGHPVARRGQRVTYTITVTNHGPQWATGVLLHDTPSLPLRVLSVHTTHGRCTISPPVFNCALGTIRIYARARITVVVRAPGPGTVTDAASAISESRDSNPFNNLSHATLRVLRSAQRPPPPTVTG